MNEPITWRVLRADRYCSLKVSASMIRRSENQRRVDRLDKLSRLLDSAFRIPGTNVRIGLDSIIGLIPAAGDTLGAVLSSYIIFEAARLGVPKATLVRMIANVAVEVLVGAIPILGDVFDIAWRANIKNFTLLRAHTAVGHHRERSSRQITRLFFWVILLATIGLVALSLILLRFLYQIITS